MKKWEVNFEEAVKLIKQGEVVAIPTETVYGLAGSAKMEGALKKIFKIKKRPFFNPLIVHCFNSQQMQQFHSVRDPILNKMTDYFCPGPLTFVLGKTDLVNSLVTGGFEKVALRIPQHPLTLKLLRETGHALCAPSANFFGKLSPTYPEQVHDMFKGKVPVLNGGPCKVGIESTVIEPDFKNRVISILRPGMVRDFNFLKWLKKERLKGWTVKDGFSPASPGQMKQHYQPIVPLVIVRESTLKKGYKGFLKPCLQNLYPGCILQQLKLKSPPELAAQSLYHDLYNLSKNPRHVIYVVKPFVVKQKWKALWDRLQKASSQTV